jgi:hypothetical protein
MKTRYELADAVSWFSTAACGVAPCDSGSEEAKVSAEFNLRLQWSQNEAKFCNEINRGVTDPVATWAKARQFNGLGHRITGDRRPGP